jgi:hypothetical protein
VSTGISAGENMDLVVLGAVVLMVEKLPLKILLIRSSKNHLSMSVGRKDDASMSVIN